MDFTEAVKTLESQNCRVQDKVLAYQAILSDFQSESTHQGDESLRLESQRVLKLLSRDIHLGAENVVDMCLQVLQHCFRISYFRSSQSSDSAQLLQALIGCAQKTASVDILKRNLECLIAQNFTSTLLNSQVVHLVEMMEAVNLKAKSQSRSVMEETVSLCHRLDEQIPEGLGPLSKRWARLVLPGLVAVSDLTREKSFKVLVKYKDNICHAPELSKHLTKAITSGLAQSLKCLMTKDEIYAMKTCALVIEICGKEFHKGPSINSMLEIVEIGFKSNPLAKCQAFIAWRSLITNFGLDSSVISDPKRLKLLMMVFKYDNAKTESVAVEKMITWWHFVLKMGQKLSVNFEKIVYPMLQFCVGNSKVQLSQPSRIALKPSTTNLQSSVLSPQARNGSELLAFPAVQRLGLEAVALLLSKLPASHAQGITWTLEHPSCEIFAGSASFAKHATYLLNVTRHIFKELNKDLEESLVLYTWKALASHIKTGLESSTKSELKDILSTFLTDLHCVVEEKTFKGDTLFKMADMCSIFPVKVLASTAFNVRGTVRGCPALLLSEVLLSPAVMETSSGAERYLKLFSTLVSAGASNVQGALEFLQTVSELLDSNSLSLESAEQLWKMWNTVAQTLQETIISSNEVNQGDALEYNFGCMCVVLLLPIKQQLASRVSQVVLKALLKSWKELFHSFARLSALVPTAEANVCIEEISGKILSKWEMEFKEPSNLEFLASLAQKMLDCVDFSAFATNQGPGSMLTLSPSKWTRRRQKPLGNLHSFIHLLQTIQNTINTLIFSKDEQSNISALIMTANALVDLYMRLFSHINTPALIMNTMRALAEPMSHMFWNNSECKVQRLFVPSFMAKLEKLWHEIALCIGGRYSEPHRSELLANMSPLFEVTFLHSRRAIKNQALALWNTTFSRAVTLDYPAALKPVLLRVKEKMSIVLPGWITPEDIPVIAESPYSEMSMGVDSQVVPPPVLPSMPSPKRPRASMLNKEVSPVRTKNLSPSPATTKSSPAKVMTPKQARKLFAPAASTHNVVDLLPDKEFVVIQSPATIKKRLLTEHQKEVLKEKSVLPAMYNNLDASQDVSLMSQFGTDTQNECSMTQDIIVVNSSNSQDQAQKSNPPTMLPPKNTEKLQSVRSSKRLSERSQSKESEKSESDEPCGITGMSDTSKPSDKEGSKPESTFGASSKEKESSAEASTVEEAPFMMFRQNGSSSPPLSLSQDDQLRKGMDGILVRKVQSEDSLSSNDKNLRKVLEREPRRVQLKKLDSPAKVADKQISKHVLSPCRVSVVRIPIEGLSSGKEGKEVPSTDQRKQLDSLAKELDKQNSVSGVLSSWSAHLVENMSNSVHKDSDKPIATGTEESLTLVEDTQSPDNLKKQNSKQAGQSITETPTKSDDSVSPHLRSSSARKLFVDEAPRSKSDCTSAATTPLSSKQQQASAVNNPPSSVSQDDAISASQGFEPAEDMAREQPKSHDHHTLFGFSQLITEQQSEIPSLEGNTKSSFAPTGDKESDSIIPSTEESDSFMPFMMPTFASPSTHAQSSLSSSKSSESSSKTQCSPSETSSRKSSSSSEIEFFPAQSTFQEGSLKESVNKRKKATPKKYSPEKSKKRIRCLKNPYRLREEHKKKMGSPKLGDKDKHTSLRGLENLTNSSPELGEITPDMKSPTDATPQRGHSSTKRKRKLSKDATENPKARKSISPEVDKEAMDASDVSQQEQNAFQAIKTALKQERKKSAVSHITRSASKSKHMLRTRSKTSTRPSPPTKRRKLSGGGQAETNEASQLSNLPSCTEEKKSKDNNESDSDDNTPLVNLKTSSAAEDSMSEGNPKLDDSAPPPVLDLVLPNDPTCSDSVKENSHRSKIMSPKRGKANAESSPPRLVKMLIGAGQAETEENGCGNLPQLSREEKTGDENIESDSDDNVPLVNLKNTSADKDSLSQNQDDISSEDTRENICNDSAPTTDLDTAVPDNSIAETQESQVTESPSKSDKGVTYEVVDSALSTVLSEIQREILSQQNASGKQQHILNDQSTPLLLSEDLDAEMNQSPEESQDHLQAGQSCRHSLVAESEQPGGEPSSSREALSESGLPAKLPQQSHLSHHTEPLGDPEGDNGCEVDSQNNINVCQDMQGNDGAINMEIRHNPDIPQLQEQNGSGNGDNQCSMFAETPVKSGTSSEDFGGRSSSKTPGVGKPTETRSLLYDWSPSKSPSFSILKKSNGSPSPGRNRVSFAEPVVNGESPVREKYHIESMPTSPLISKSSSQRKGTPFTRSLGRVSGYKRRLNQSPRQVRPLPGSDCPSGSPVKSQSQSPSQYKATQESQLDSTNPIFPDLIDCTKPVDDILPQLTSSLWYRGLHHLMKGRSLNTIGDLSALTEVQVSQLPIRHPKVETVRTSLKNYMAQHGLFKPVINLSAQDAVSTPSSKGATMEQAVTPSSIADEGIEIRRHDNDLDRLSPIEGVELESSFSSASDADASTSRNDAGKESTGSLEAGKSAGIISTLTKLVEDAENGEGGVLKHLHTLELFEVHQKLNHLFAAVVGELKTRHSQDS